MPVFPHPQVQRIGNPQSTVRKMVFACDRSSASRDRFYGALHVTKRWAFARQMVRRGSASIRTRHGDSFWKSQDVDA
jgi:hypothetical protein